jgi:hypothetical protein
MSATGFANALASSLNAEVVSKKLLSKGALFFEFDKFSGDIFCTCLSSGMLWHKMGCPISHKWDALHKMGCPIFNMNEML